MKIYAVPDGRRYWVVRAESCQYYDHFVNNGLIALSHLNDLGVEVADTPVFRPDEGWLKDAVAAKSEEKKASRRQESVSFNQIKNFIFDIQDGDWVITVGDAFLRVGMVTGEPFISNEKVVQYYDVKKDLKVEMESNLRRKVNWGPAILRGDVPFGLLSSLKANQTVFNIDKHWESLYHTLYPAFSRGDDLYVSLKIRQEHDISNFSVVQLLLFLNEVEVIAKALDEGLDAANFQQAFEYYVKNGLLTLTTKAQFHSPGDIWSRIDFSVLKKPMMYKFLVAYAMLFGNEHFGMDGILDLESRQKLWAVVADRLQQRDMEAVVKSLELTKPNYDTSVLEQKDATPLKHEAVAFGDILPKTTGTTPEGKK